MSTTYLKTNPMILPKQRTCRICAGEGHNFVSIFHDKQEIKQMIKCLPVQIRPNDDLPHYICPSCLDALDITYNLNVLSLKAHLRLLGKTNKYVKQEMTSPRRLVPIPKSSKTNNDLQPITRNRIRVDKTSENAFDKADDNHDSSFSVKEEPIDPDLCEPVDFKPPRQRKRKLRAAKIPSRASSPGTFRLPTKVEPKIEKGSSRASSPGTSRRPPKVQPKTAHQLIPVKQEPNSTTLKRKYCKAVELQCSECQRLFLSTSVSEAKRKRIVEGGAAPICASCGKLGKKTMLPGELEPKRPRLDNESINDGSRNDNKNVKIPFKQPANKPPAQHDKRHKTEAEKASVQKETRDDSAKGHKCQYCGRCYRRRSALQEHILKYHVPNEQWKHVCTKCDTRFYAAYKLAKHQERECAPRTIPCSLCTRTFQYEWGLKRHLKIIHAYDMDDQ